MLGGRVIDVTIKWREWGRFEGSDRAGNLTRYLGNALMDFHEIWMASSPRLAEHTLSRRTRCDDGERKCSNLKWRYWTSEPAGVGSSRMQFAICKRKGRQHPMRVNFDTHAQGTSVWTWSKFQVNCSKHLAIHFNPDMNVEKFVFSKFT